MHKTSRGTLPHSVSTFIRREKARIRRVALSREEAEKKIAELYVSKGAMLAKAPKKG